jgi:hypothetical protein
MKKLGFPFLALALAGAMFAAALAEAKTKTVPKMINVHELCNDPDLAVAVVSQMCANPKVRLAIAKELRQHPDFNNDFAAQHPSGGG